MLYLLEHHGHINTQVDAVYVAAQPEEVLRYNGSSSAPHANVEDDAQVWVGCWNDCLWCAVNIVRFPSFER